MFALGKRQMWNNETDNFHPIENIVYFEPYSRLNCSFLHFGRSIQMRRLDLILSAPIDSLFIQGTMREHIFTYRRTFTLNKQNSISLIAFIIIYYCCIHFPFCIQNRKMAFFSGLNAHHVHDMNATRKLIHTQAKCNRMSLLLSLKWCIYVSGFLLEIICIFSTDHFLALRIFK